MNYENAWNSYEREIGSILERRAFVRKSCLRALGEGGRSAAERLFGLYGSGSREEREQLERQMAERYSAFLHDFFESHTTGSEAFASCLVRPEVCLRKLLDSARAGDEGLYNMIRKNTFSFDDLPLLDDRAIHKLLGEVDAGVLAKGLAGADEGTRNKILKNMAKKDARNLVEREFPKYSSLSEEERLDARHEICKAVMRLAKSASVIIPGPEGDELI